MKCIIHASGGKQCGERQRCSSMMLQLFTVQLKWCVCVCVCAGAWAEGSGARVALPRRRVITICGSPLDASQFWWADVHSHQCAREHECMCEHVGICGCKGERRAPAQQCGSTKTEQTKKLQNKRNTLIQNRANNFLPHTIYYLHICVFIYRYIQVYVYFLFFSCAKSY